MRALMAGVGLWSMAACAPGPRASDAIDPAGGAASLPGVCDAGAAQRFIGETASEAMGRQLLAATGARELRWAPPRSALSMDYRADRLTVEYDDHLKITRISCG